MFVWTTTQHFHWQMVILQQVLVTFGCNIGNHRKISTSSTIVLFPINFSSKLWLCKTNIQHYQVHNRRQTFCAVNEWQWFKGKTFKIDFYLLNNRLDCWSSSVIRKEIDKLNLKYELSPLLNPQMHLNKYEKEFWVTQYFVFSTLFFK